MQMDMGAELGKIIPELWLAMLVLILIPMSTFLPTGRKQAVTWFAIGGLATSLIPSVIYLGQPKRAAFGETYLVDPFAIFFKLLCVVASVVVLLISLEHFRGWRAEGEIAAMVVLATLGMELLAGSTNLILIALSLQIITIASYILVGMLKEEPRSGEAALKFFLFAATAGAVMLYGMSFIYGLTGSLNLIDIAQKLPGADLALVVLGLTLLLAGYGYEITIFPFHAWVPDTYQGAATPIAAFLSVGPKAAGLAVLARTLLVAFPRDLAGWPEVVAVSAAVTMTFGNIVALRQHNLKRLLAYSSIAQAGYLLMGVASAGRDPLGISGLLFYLVAYLFMNLGAFAVITAIEQEKRSVDLTAYQALAREKPFLAFSLTLFLLSLAGIPPLGGFIGKTILFGAALAANFWWLTVIAAINTAISLYYYAKVLAPMYLQPPAKSSQIDAQLSGRTNRLEPGRELLVSAPPSPILMATIGLVEGVTLLIGVFPELVLNILRLATQL